MTSLDSSILATKVLELEDKVRRIADKQQISETYGRYTRGLNRCDLQLLSSAFWSDAQINYGVHSRLRDDWISAWEKTRYQKGLACQAHYITNQTMDLEGDIAHVESYLLALWRPAKDDEPGKILGGRYVDRLDRRNNEWRIAVRVFIPHFWSEVRSTFSSEFSENVWPHSASGLGSCDKSDPSYLRPLMPTQGMEV